MKRILAGIAFASIAATSAFADDMATRYGNTVVVQGPDGKEVARIYYDQDGAAKRKLPDGAEIVGTWKMEGANLCFSQVTPAPKPEEAKQCAPFSGPKKVGETWKVTTAMGELTATLKAGRP